MLAVHTEAELRSCEEAECNGHNRQPAIWIVKAKFGEFDSLLAVERSGGRREVHHHIFASVVNGDVALLHASAECLDDVSCIIDENCRMAPVSKHLVRPPITERLAKANEAAIKSLRSVSG